MVIYHSLDIRSSLKSLNGILFLLRRVDCVKLFKGKEYSSNFDIRPLYLVIIQYFLSEAVRAKKYSLNTKSLMVFNIGSIFLVIDLAV